MAEDAQQDSRRRSRPWWALLWVPALGYLLWTLGRVALHDSLTSISDDSSNYLVMARHFSPWLPESDAIRGVWPMQYFPPLFPLLLAVTGTAHSLLAAHGLVLALGLCGLLAFHWFVRETLGAGATPAHAASLLLALLPGFALGLQGILSEALFLLLSIAFMALAPRCGTWPASLACALLLAGALLTRSAGSVLALALVLQATAGSLRERRVPWRALAMLALALGVHVLVAGALQPPRVEYARVWQGVLGMGAGELAELAVAQVQALLASWFTFFMIYWSGDRPVAVAIVAAALLLGLAGTALRLRDNRLDAWYVAGSMGVLLAWPYPGQMVRLLFPLVPLLLAHAVWMVLRLAAARHGFRWLPAACGAALLAVILPPHAYLHGRLDLAEQLGLVPVYEWLRKPDMQEARRELGLQNQMLRDFALLPARVEPQAQIAAYEPSYIALLGERPARALGFPLAADGLRSLRPGDAVILTAIHPRQSRSSIDGLAIPASLRLALQPQLCSTEPLEGRSASCLLIVAL